MLQDDTERPLARDNAKLLDSIEKRSELMPDIETDDVNFESQDQSVESDGDTAKTADEVASPEGSCAGGVSVMDISHTSFTSWMPPIPFQSSRFSAIATHVSDDGLVYLHDLKFSPLLTEIRVNMTKYFNLLPPTPSDTRWSIGDVCTVRYYLDQNWYRGVVTGVKPQSIKVLMIDYGNEEECAPNDLYKRAMYINVPPFANKIALYGVSPPSGKWLTGDVDLLHFNIVEKEIDVELKGKGERKKPRKATFYLNLVNVNEFIMRSFSNWDKEQKMHDSTKNLCDSEVTIGQGSGSPNTQSSLVSFHGTYTQVELLHDEFNANIINVLNYNHIIFELISTEHDETYKYTFEEVSREMKKEAASRPQLETLSVGDACVAPYSEDGEWYRAQVFEPPRNGTVYVWFVDFGNLEDVPVESVRTADPRWMRLPVEQFSAKIQGISLSEHMDANTVANEMLMHCGTVKRVRIMTRKPLTVQIFDKDNGELAYKDLVDAGHLVLDVEQHDD